MNYLVLIYSNPANWGHPTFARAEGFAAANGTGRIVRRDDLVFTNDPLRNQPWRPELVTRCWQVLRKRAGLEHVKIHGLRHFVAAELLTAGLDLRTVANRLGHARMSTTLDIYWAWVPARDRDAAQHLE